MFRKKPPSRPNSKGLSWFGAYRENPVSQEKTEPKSRSRPVSKQSTKWHSSFWPSAEYWTLRKEQSNPETLSDPEIMNLLQKPLVRSALTKYKDIHLHKYLVEAINQSKELDFYFPWSVWYRKDETVKMAETVLKKSELQPALDKLADIDASGVYILRSLVRPGLKCSKIVFKLSRKADFEFFSTLACLIPSETLTQSFQKSRAIIGIAVSNTSKNYSILRVFLGNAANEEDSGVEDIVRNISDQTQTIFDRAVLSIMFTKTHDTTFDTVYQK